MEKYSLNKPIFNNKHSESKLRKANRLDHVSPESLQNVPQNKSKCIQTFERKLPNKLNPISHTTSKNEVKKFTSKIPVLQRSKLGKIENTKKSSIDANLSAADRRQKFQQSHQFIAPPVNLKKTSNYLQPVELQNELMCWYDGKFLSKLDAAICSSTQDNKTVLPPIKDKINNMDKTAVSQKKKNLLGEITHFPALCNVSNKPSNQNNLSLVPHLPYIFPVPVASPHNVSIFLDREGKFPIKNEKVFKTELKLHDCS